MPSLPQSFGLDPFFFGTALLEASDGLETVYETLLTMEGEILERMQQFGPITAGLAQGAFLTSSLVETLTFQRYHHAAQRGVRPRLNPSDDPQIPTCC